MPYIVITHAVADKFNLRMYNTESDPHIAEAFHLYKLQEEENLNLNFMAMLLMYQQKLILDCKIKAQHGH